MISTVCRGAYPGACRCTSSTRRRPARGKSYLLSTVSWIATGQAMPVLGAGKDEEEMEKRLDAAVISGQPLICIDNVVGEIGGETLCRLTEQPRPQVRILGVLKTRQCRRPRHHVLRQRQQHHRGRRSVPAGGPLPARCPDGAPGIAGVQAQPDGDDPGRSRQIHRGLPDDLPGLYRRRAAGPAAATGVLSASGRTRCARRWCGSARPIR